KVPRDSFKFGACALAFLLRGVEMLAAVLLGSAAEPHRRRAEDAGLRLQRLGYRDNGAALWNYTFELLRPYAGLVKLVAIRLERELVLDGEAVDRLVGVRS